MRIHSSYLVGTHTVSIEASELPGDAASAIKLTMGKTCVLLSVALRPVRTQGSDPSRLAVDFASAPTARTNDDFRGLARTTEADQALAAIIRDVVNAVVPEDFAPQIRVMVRVLTDDSVTPIDVPVLQALGAALHLLKVLRAIRAVFMAPRPPAAAVPVVLRRCRPTRRARAPPIPRHRPGWPSRR
jgi:polyribonucleotide nucleotidyltransferase